MRKSTQPFTARTGNDQPIFTDTSALYMLLDRDDPRHAQCKAFVARNTRPLLTSDYVLDEIITNVRYDFGHQVARALGDRLLRSNFCPVLPVEPADRDAAWEIFCQYADQDFSFTDCTSFTLMRRLGVQEAFAFDHHFWTAGFVVLPG